MKFIMILNRFAIQEIIIIKYYIQYTYDIYIYIYNLAITRLPLPEF